MANSFMKLGLMAAVTLGLIYVPDAMFYDNPRLTLGI